MGENKRATRFFSELGSVGDTAGDPGKGADGTIKTDPADPFGVIWIYHVLALSYKWTIDDIDKLTLPFIRLLLKEIDEMPSVDIATHRQNQAMLQNFKNEQKNVLSSLAPMKGVVKRRPPDVNRSG
jgi:hypothetical protein